MQSPENAQQPSWLLEVIQEGFLILNDQQRVISCNPAALTILGRPVREIVGLTLSGLFPQIDDREIKELLEGLRSEVTVHDPKLAPFLTMPTCKMLAQASDGQTLVLLVDLSEKMRQQAELAHLTSTMAVSQELLRHKNEELDRSLAEMGRMNEQLAALDELKTQFLSNTSHELRTPLNTILGALQLVREGLCETPQEQADYLDSALDAGRRLLKVINEMLDSAKLSAGKMTFLIEDHSVSSLFDEVYSLLNPQARQKDLQLQVSLPDGEGLMIRADFDKAKQALMNLVANAIKFTKNGSIAVSAQMHADRPDLVLFRVRDSGIGVPPARQREIFERFTQVDGSATRSYDGTGLGLAITKSLIEMMGGSIELNSEGTGKGTEVLFTLPLGGTKADRGDDSLRGPEDIYSELPRTF